MNAFNERKAWAIQKIDDKIEQMDKDAEERAKQIASEQKPAIPPAPQQPSTPGPTPAARPADDNDVFNYSIKELYRLKGALQVRVDQGASGEVQRLNIELQTLLNKFQ